MGCMFDINTKKTFKGIVDQTLSFKEMTEIAKNELQYRTSHLGVLQAMNTGVFGILKILASDHPGFMTESQKSAQEQLRLQWENDEKLSKLLSETDEYGNITKEAQIKASKIIAERIAQLEDKISVSGKAAEIIREAKESKDPYSVLQKAIEGTSGELQKELIRARESLVPLHAVQDDLSNILEEAEKGTDPYLIKSFGEMKKKYNKKNI